MKKPIISFCIATYQRYDILKELIEEILSVESDDLEVVVNDDHSMDASYEKIKTIKDERLRIYSNQVNLGSIENVFQLLEYGKGTYLFYLNDRDNVDPIKILKLISILRLFDQRKVAFAKCVPVLNVKKDFEIFQPGRDSFVEFACRQQHISGFIFRNEVWRSIKNRRDFFTGQKHGDWPYTHIYALMAVHDSGAVIYNDICNVDRERIDFAKVRSGFYLKRKDKRLWYKPEVQWRELRTAYLFLKSMPVSGEWVRDAICKRYNETLGRIMLDYSFYVSLPMNTLHYGLQISNHKFKNHCEEFYNGLYVWIHANFLWRQDPNLLIRINQITAGFVKRYLEVVSKDFLSYIFAADSK